MAQVKWTEPALNDLNDIAEYIALDKPSAAQKLVQDVFQSVKQLVDFPELERRPPELPDSNYRELITGPLRIFYRMERTTIYILYVMCQERALRNFLLEERAKKSD